MKDRHPTGERLAAYLLDELASAEREAVAGHLRDCQDCRAAASSLEAALAAYRTEDPGAADEAALERLLRAARTTRPARAAPPRPRWAAVALSAAVAVVIFLGGFWAGQQSGRDGPRSARPDEAAEPAGEPRPVDREPPSLRFAAADADLLGGLAARDTTWN